MKKKEIIIVVVFNLIIALGFYCTGLDAKVTDISSDLANIIPICKKIDDPSLYKNDLYLGDLNNIKYYTPFYVHSLRFIAKLTNQDYIQALNILSFTTHFFYGIIWFLFFFYIKKDFWIAFGFSIFARGVIWPPGMELLGISDLWTIMPRTVFIAFIPLPFLIYKSNFRYSIYLAALVLGLLVNFHPISGIGAILLYVCVFLTEYYFNKNLFNLNSIKILSISIFFITMGLLPYLLTYLLNVKYDNNINQTLFQEAIKYRINEVFFDSFLFIKSWNKPFLYFFMASLILFGFLDSSLKKKNFKIIVFSILVLFVFSNCITHIENYINHTFKYNFRFAFQLIRSQKLIIVMMQIATFLLVIEVFIKYKIANNIKPILVILYLAILSLSTTNFVKKIPLLGDDISSFILPNQFMLNNRTIKDDGILDVFNYINAKTDKKALFYCKNVYFRTATNRSEVLDFHAAGILIEGNSEAYITAYQDFKKYQYANTSKRIELLKSKKVNYIVDTKQWDNLNLVYKNSKYYIYKL